MFKKRFINWNNVIRFCSLKQNLCYQTFPLLICCSPGELLIVLFFPCQQYFPDFSNNCI